MINSRIEMLFVAAVLGFVGCATQQSIATKWASKPGNADKPLSFKDCSTLAEFRTYLLEWQLNEHSCYYLGRDEKWHYAGHVNSSVIRRISASQVTNAEVNGLKDDWLRRKKEGSAFLEAGAPYMRCGSSPAYAIWIEETKPARRDGDWEESLRTDGV